MAYEDAGKAVKNFVKYLDTLPIDKSPYKNEIKSVIKEIKAMSVLNPTTWRLGQIAVQLNMLQQYAKHPATLKNIQKVLDAIHKTTVHKMNVTQVSGAEQQKESQQIFLNAHKLKVLEAREFMKDCNNPLNRDELHRVFNWFNGTIYWYKKGGTAYNAERKQMQNAIKACLGEPNLEIEP